VIKKLYRLISGRRRRRSNLLELWDNVMKWSVEIDVKVKELAIVDEERQQPLLRAIEDVAAKIAEEFSKFCSRVGIEGWKGEGEGTKYILQHLRFRCALCPREYSIYALPEDRRCHCGGLLKYVPSLSYSMTKEILELRRK